MASFNIGFFSNSLRRNVSFEMFIPNDIRTDIQNEETVYTKRDTKTLFLLHGYTRSAGSWGLEEFARRYNFAMIMPNGENAFYLDGESMGHKYLTYLGTELTELSAKPSGLQKKPRTRLLWECQWADSGRYIPHLNFPKFLEKLSECHRHLLFTILLI